MPLSESELQRQDWAQPALTSGMTWYNLVPLCFWNMFIIMSIYSAWMVEANFFRPYINGAPRKAAQAPDMVNLHGPCSCAIPSVQDSRDLRNELRKKKAQVVKPRHHGTNQSVWAWLSYVVIITCCYVFWLVVEPPLWKIWKSVGMIIPNCKNKIMFQTTNQCFILFLASVLSPWKLPGRSVFIGPVPWGNICISSIIRTVNEKRVRQRVRFHIFGGFHKWGQPRKTSICGKKKHRIFPYKPSILGPMYGNPHWSFGIPMEFPWEFRSPEAWPRAEPSVPAAKAAELSSWQNPGIPWVPWFLSWSFSCFCCFSPGFSLERCCHKRMDVWICI